MQGKVDVASSKTDARNKLAFLVQLSPGEQLAVHVGDRPVLRHVDVRDATAWQQHRIVFHDVTLGEAAQQLNRYDTPELLNDPSVRGLRLIGVFGTDDICRFVDSVVRFLPVESNTHQQGRIIIAQRPWTKETRATGSTQRKPRRVSNTR